MNENTFAINSGFLLINLLKREIVYHLEYEGDWYLVSNEYRFCDFKKVLHEIENSAEEDY